jgi:hypothetical protein
MLLEEQVASSKAARERADHAEERNRARDLLENLPGPTEVDPVTEKALRSAGFGMFLEPRPAIAAKSLPMDTGAGRTQEQDLTGPQGPMMAKPFVPPALKAANEATERRLADISA